MTGRPTGRPRRTDPRPRTSRWAKYAADAIIAAGWRNFAVYPDETLRDCDTLLARADGGKPTCIVGNRLCYWTGTEWRWAE